MTNAKTISGAVRVAKSVIEGKPCDNCPIDFSYVNAAIWLAQYILELEPATIVALEADELDQAADECLQEAGFNDRTSHDD